MEEQKNHMGVRLEDLLDHLAHQKIKSSAPNLKITTKQTKAANIVGTIRVFNNRLCLK